MTAESGPGAGHSTSGGVFFPPSKKKRKSLAGRSDFLGGYGQLGKIGGATSPERDAVIFSVDIPF